MENKEILCLYCGKLFPCNICSLPTNFRFLSITSKYELPTDTTIGDIFFCTFLNKMYIFDGTDLVDMTPLKKEKG